MIRKQSTALGGKAQPYWEVRKEGKRFYCSPTLEHAKQVVVGEREKEPILGQQPWRLSIHHVRAIGGVKVESVVTDVV